MPLEVEVRPAWPYRLRSRLGGDGVARRRGRGGQPAAGDRRRPRRRPRLAAARLGGSSSAPAAADPERPAPRESLELAIERMRFALGVDDDFSEFARAFRGDPLIGEVIHHRPWLRPRRRPWPWEALAWAVTEQLIEVRRAVEIQRRDRAPLGRSPAARRARRLARPGPAARRPRRRGGRRRGPGRARRLRPRALARDRPDPLRARGRRRAASTRRAPSGDRRAARGSRASGRGRCRCSASAAAASPTRCPPATSPTSSSSAPSPASAAGRPWPRSRSTSPLRAFRGLAGGFALARWHGSVGQDRRCVAA